MAEKECVFCKIVADVEAKRFNEDYVAATDAGVLVLEWHQVWRGYCLFIAKPHVEEAFDLFGIERRQFLNDAVEASWAIKTAVTATRMNNSQLGNEVPHLHFHLTPRFGKDDPGNMPNRPIWQVDRAIRKPSLLPTAEQKHPTKQVIRSQLQSLGAQSSRWRMM